ncbi:MAG: IS200/IS605 family transposase [Pseudomonadales bacterium]
MKAQSHCVYSTHYHLVMATAERRKVLTRRVLERFETLARERTEAWGGELLEIRADTDYVHLHIELPPKVAVAEFTNALKTGTSRRLRSEFARLQSQKQLWSQSYCVIGGEQTPVEAIDQYLESQGHADSSRGRPLSPGRAPMPPGELDGLSEAASAFLGSHPEEARLAIAAGLEAAASQFENGSGFGAQASGNGRDKNAREKGARQKSAAPPRRAPRAGTRTSSAARS